MCCFCIWNLENDNLKDLINPKQVTKPTFSLQGHALFFSFFLLIFMFGSFFSFSVPLFSYFHWSSPSPSGFVESSHYIVFNMYDINLQPLLRAGNVMLPS